MTKQFLGTPGAVLEKYAQANLVPFLECIRKPGRYAAMDGLNTLTNAAPASAYDQGEVVREMQRARHSVEGARFLPEFSHSQQGFAYGLNPYTDWSLTQIDRPPTHYYLFLGIDWYSVSELGASLESWFTNPFADTRDRYWHNVWAWILQTYKMSADGSHHWNIPISPEAAAAFIRADGGGFIFHNRIPYLRPAGCSSAGTAWYTKEWNKPGVRADVIEDLRILRVQTGDRIAAICTSKDSEEALREAGYKKVASWSSHPSRVFHPSQFMAKNFWFRNCFDVEHADRAPRSVIVE